MALARSPDGWDDGDGKISREYLRACAPGSAVLQRLLQQRHTTAHTHDRPALLKSATRSPDHAVDSPDKEEVKAMIACQMRARTDGDQQ
ncbi:hypothetical protein GCM10010116_58020 [Microbispora rosea subsp. aerata]|nr:hypothetical protein GCM10010116_58020 [Microbispora rosea subsp. aerata]GIH58789.1 hypothetical protein Mro02_57030 [Microbispora rosea subsp. aerata]GLJ86736.1 hypothetical protein GCM10017588_54750 [Microbispora rosea subsp. aerata]